MVIVKHISLHESVQQDNLSIVKAISDQRGWHTLQLFEKASCLKEPYGMYYFYENDQLSGYFIISPSDGSDPYSSNMAFYQTEESAFWICSLYSLHPNIETFYQLYQFCQNELICIYPVYMYLENEKLIRIAKRLKNVSFISDLDYVFKISKSNSAP